MKNYVTLKGRFSAGHFYRREEWSEEKNQEQFGACYGEHGHGHDYRVEVTLGPYSLDIEENELASALSERQRQLNELLGKLEHQHLNLDMKDFAERIPTTEVLAHYFLTELPSSPKSLPLERVRLFEGENIFSEVAIDRASI